MDFDLVGEISEIGTDPMHEQNAKPSFAIGVSNDDSDDLSVGMLYRVLPDDVAAAENFLRIIDDSGEDYLYPAGRFVMVTVPDAKLPKLLAASAAKVA